MRLQRTIKREVSFSGIGLHTGKEVTVRLKPASRDSGIAFYRKDKDVLIRADIINVADTAFSTTLLSRGAKIKTVEHFLAAASGLGIDNMIVEVTGPELPVLDGSATGIVDVFLKAGIAKQSKQVSFIRITKPLIYEEAHSKIICLPYEGRKFTYHIHYDHHLIMHQEMSIEINEKSFITEIAPARTFGFLRDVEKLKTLGLALGGSLQNAIVIDDNGVLNPSGLRFDNEFVRHKILDSIGDFALAGYPILGHFILEKSGHSANTKFITELLSTVECYDFINSSSASFREPLPSQSTAYQTLQLPISK